MTEQSLEIIEPSPIEQVFREVESLDDAAVEQRFAEATLRTAAGLAEMAACVRVLESRGRDLSKLKMALLPYLRLIAQGQLLPELVLRFAGRPDILGSAAKLPLPDQRRLADGGTVEIAVIESDRTIGKREVDPRVLSRRELARIFGDSGIIPASKQQVQPRPQRIIAQRRVFVDSDSRTVKISNCSATLADVMAAIAEAAGRQGDIDPRDVNGPSVGARLTETERDRLRAACKAHRLEEAEFVRRAILTWLI